MKLTDLSPCWIHENVFAFKCPCALCQAKDADAMWLCCKNAAMESRSQYELFEQTFGDDWNQIVVPMNESFAWTISGRDFATMSVSPSIDASASGHWHGHITNGNVQ
jgi:hypothetical protein